MLQDEDDLKISRNQLLKITKYANESEEALNEVADTLYLLATILLKHSRDVKSGVFQKVHSKKRSRKNQ